MARKRTAQPHKAEATPASASDIPPLVQKFLREPSTAKGSRNPKPLNLGDLRRRLNETDVALTVPAEEVLTSVNRIKPARTPVEELPEDVIESLDTLKPRLRRFHGIKIPIYWFPLPQISSTCADRFGYMSANSVRASTRLPFSTTSRSLLGSSAT